MKLFTAAILATGCLAAPVEKRAVTDADILQYALTLEHLENVFYKEGLSKFPRQQWLDAGFSSEYYDNLKYIAHDEESHVTALTQALSAAGAQPVAACEYSFPYTDPKSFVALSSALEGVGTSAYLGGAGLIQSKEYLGVAGSILVVEALHTSLQRFNLKQIAPANPYGTALGINPVYTLAASFIKSCPETNAALPVKAFPTLTTRQGNPTSQGITFQFAAADADTSGEVFVTFLSGLSTVSMPTTKDGMWIGATIPDEAEGQTYALLTNKDVSGGMLTDDVVIAGPAILEVTPMAPTFDTGIRRV